MYIKKIKIKNFQIHEKISLNLEKGINVIVGPTNHGKSAIIRALFWLLNNRPTNANKKYKRDTASKQDEVYVSITDDKGNVVVRKPKMYQINNDKPLKAFGTDVPHPVKKLFPLKEINWQKQFDPPFMVLDTGGKAAKKLSIITGADDQEALLSKWKLEKRDTKNEIKRLKDNIDESNEIINDYKDVPAYLEICTELEEQSEEINNHNKKTIALSNLINKINDIDEQMLEIDFIALSKKLDDLIKLKNKFDNNQEKLYELNDIIIELIKIKEIKVIDYDSLHSTLNEIEGGNQILNKNRKQTTLLNSLINRLQGLVGHFFKLDFPLADKKLTQLRQSFDEIEQQCNDLSKIQKIIDDINKLNNQEKIVNNEIKVILKKTGNLCPICNHPWKGDK